MFRLLILYFILKYDGKIIWGVKWRREKESIGERKRYYSDRKKHRREKAGKRERRGD